MNLDKYEYMMDETLLNFQFESLGPNGRVLKVIVVTPQNSNGVTYFNLAFGDWDKAQQKLDDLSITNNNDREKVLATVAAVVLEFLNNFPDMMVYAEGSTPSRTRLYQIGIASQYEKISSLLHVYGFVNGQWEEFRKGYNYEAFLVSLK
ncbi:DUF6934 family protein [Parafilimonas sp.]|uniref:DUF6934 family protein n=1 Tax=Parafilimonas sp. TaxID=1969739 RepID=UPI0039E335B4